MLNPEYCDQILILFVTEIDMQSNKQNYSVLILAIFRKTVRNRIYRRSV